MGECQECRRPSEKRIVLDEGISRTNYPQCLVGGTANSDGYQFKPTNYPHPHGHQNNLGIILMTKLLKWHFTPRG